MVDGTGNHFTRGQAFYDLILAVHPTNPNLVIAGGIDLHRTLDGGYYMVSDIYIGMEVMDNPRFMLTNMLSISVREPATKSFLDTTAGLPTLQMPEIRQRHRPLLTRTLVIM